MATAAAKMFPHYQNGKFETQRKDMEVSEELHLKMSKKIAQLTKVIYALNTKNDEHELAIQNVKQLHEDKLQQILSDTKAKVDAYAKQINTDTDYLQKIEFLQNRIKEYEGKEEETLETLDKFKRASAQMEEGLKSQHSQNIIDLSQEVLTAKNGFDALLGVIDSTKQQLIEEKEAAIKELNDKHQKELEEHQQKALQAQQMGQNSTKEELENRYKSDIERLHIDNARLSSEKKQLTEDYEAKLKKSQDFYEKELEAFKTSQSSLHLKELEQLKSQYESLTMDSHKTENQHQKRVDELLHQIVIKEEEEKNLKLRLEQLENHLNGKDTSLDLLRKQVIEAQKESSAALSRLKEMEAELSSSQMKCNQYAKDLISKSTIIGELEASALQSSATIHDLQAQVVKLKEQVERLERIKGVLESQTQAQSDDQANQVKHLQQLLDEMAKEKEANRQQFEDKIINLIATSEKQSEDLRQENLAKLASIERDQKELVERMTQDADTQLSKVKNELESLLDDERTQHNATLLGEKADHEKTKTDLMSKLTYAEDELRELHQKAKESEQGLGSAASHLNSLRDKVSKLQQELDLTRNDLRTSKSNYTTLQTDHEKLKMTHKSDITKAELELKNRLENLAIDLDKKWKDTLRKECEKLRTDITRLKDEDKRTALENLGKLKDEEYAAAKESWEKKVKELLDKLSILQSSLDSHQQNSSEEMKNFKFAADEENKKLSKKLSEIEKEYRRDIEDMEMKYKEQIKELSQQREEQSKEIESQMRAKHLEEIQAVNIAHRSQMDSFKEESENRRREEVDGLSSKHRQKMALLKTEMEHKHSIELEQITRDHHQQMHTAKMELDRAMEITRQKEGEHAMKCCELEEKIHYHEVTVKSLEEEIRRLKKGVDEMAYDLEAKGKEILRIRSEMNLAMKAKEEDIQVTHREELASLQSDHERELQDMLAEFAKAQEFLKNKISELQILLEEAEERYRDRDARPEDIAMIKQLQQAVLDKHTAMQKLVDDKKFYQMELVNRETNFNKVFSAAPNVGVMNPLMKKPKKNDSHPMKFSSSPALSNRLDPLPGSPVHDDMLNPMRPLPPATKKFIR